MIEPMSAFSQGTGKHVVRQRQGLKTAERAERFCRELEARIEEHKDSGEVLVFDDFDISENKIPTNHLESIFAALADSGVHVERFRAFGCATLDDAAATLLSGWLASVTAENCPYELHLSDCALTSDGFQAIMSALIDNDTFPAADPKAPSRGPLALYLRLEHNYIDPKDMEKAVEDGHVVKMKKGKTPHGVKGVKARIIVREDGQFQQKRGEPPAPEDVPDPRPFRGDKGKGKGKGGKSSGDWWRDSDRDRKGSSKGGKDRRDRAAP